jgi:hypothetical protein
MEVIHGIQRNARSVRRVSQRQKEIERNKPKEEDVVDVIKNDIMAPFKNFTQVNKMCGLPVKEKPDGEKS